MAAQFFISLCWLFWAAMYSFLFCLFCKFNSIFGVYITKFFQFTADLHETLHLWLFLLEHKLELMFSSIDPCTSPIVQVFSPLIDFALALIYMHVIQPPIAGDQSAPSVHVQLARQPISVCYRFACGYALVHFLSEIFILHFGLQSLSRFSPPTHRRSFKKGYPLGFYKECMFPKR